MVFTGWPHVGPGLAEVEFVEQHRLVTVCNLRSSQSKTAKSKSIEKNMSPIPPLLQCLPFLR